MDPNTLKPNQFLDALGELWTCKITTRTLRDAGRNLNLDLGELSTKVNIGMVIDLLWYGCRDSAKARGVTEDDFLDNRVTPRILPAAAKAFTAAMHEAFPGAEDLQEDPKGPAADGQPGA